jgi:hypothetical protein
VNRAETKASLHYEARTTGTADARTKSEEKAAIELVAEGKFALGGDTIGGWNWYVLSVAHAAKLRSEGYEVARAPA